MGTGAACAAQSAARLGQPTALRRIFYRRGSLSVFRPQDALHDLLPAPFSVSLRKLAVGIARGVRSWLAPGPSLPRLLLGDDAGDVRGWGDERRMDGRA